MARKNKGKEEGLAEITFHPLGMVKPAYKKSLVASLNTPGDGGSNLITSQATVHEYFIF